MHIGLYVTDFRRVPFYPQNGITETVRNKLLYEMAKTSVAFKLFSLFYMNLFILVYIDVLHIDVMYLCTYIGIFYISILCCAQYSIIRHIARCCLMYER